MHSGAHNGFTDFHPSCYGKPFVSLNGWKFYGLHVDTSLFICTSSFKSRFLTWNRGISRRIFENMTCFKKMRGTKNTKVILFNSIKAPGKSEKTSWSFATPVGIVLLTQIPSEIHLAEEATDHKVYNAPWALSNYFHNLPPWPQFIIISQVSPFHRFTPEKGGRQM